MIYYSDRLILFLFFRGQVEIACSLKKTKQRKNNKKQTNYMALVCFLLANILTIKIFPTFCY